jgi:hypothetical protein
MNTISKNLEYAYPTSVTAEKAGYGATGCWYVKLYPAIDAMFGGDAVPNSYRATKEQAKQFADTLPHPYNKQLNNHNPI